ncbi:MAG: hypothetical protein N2652_10350 [Kiritimatiellae bacterium]|nr:hypothetical protein [Kiritimatiellia bacterium]
MGVPRHYGGMSLADFRFERGFVLLSPGPGRQVARGVPPGRLQAEPMRASGAVEQPLAVDARAPMHVAAEFSRL